MLLSLAIWVGVLAGTPTKAQESSSSRTTPVGNSSCAANCYADWPTNLRYSWIRYDFSTTLTPFTVVTVINTRLNATRYVTSTGELPEGYTLPPTNDKGTQTTTQTDAKGQVVTITYPDRWEYYGTEYSWSGQLSTTAADGTGSVCSSDADTVATISVPSFEPEPYSIDPDDPFGYGYFFSAYYGSVPESYIDALTDADALHSCTISTMLPGPGYLTTAAFLTASATSFEDDGDEETTSPSPSIHDRPLPSTTNASAEPVVSPAASSTLPPVTTREPTNKNTNSPPLAASSPPTAAPKPSPTPVTLPLGSSNVVVLSPAPGGSNGAAAASYGVVIVNTPPSEGDDEPHTTTLTTLAFGSTATLPGGNAAIVLTTNAAGETVAVGAVVEEGTAAGGGAAVTGTSSDGLGGLIVSGLGGTVSAAGSSAGRTTRTVVGTLGGGGEDASGSGTTTTAGGSGGSGSAEGTAVGTSAVGSGNGGGGGSATVSSSTAGAGRVWEYGSWWMSFGMIILGRL